MSRSDKRRKPAHKSNVLNMMGYGEDASDDGDEDGFEEELAAILGGNTKKSAKKPQPKLVDWSVLNAQVEESLKDLDEDGDEEITSDDEMNLMAELNDICDESHLSVAPTTKQTRSPSPATNQGSADVMNILQSRKQMYQTGIQQSTMSSKTRRLQRGLKQIEDLMRSVKRGKNIKLDEIPPEVAVKTSKDTNDKTELPTISTSEDVSSPKTPIINQIDLIQLEPEVVQPLSPPPLKQLKPEVVLPKTSNPATPRTPEAVLSKTPETVLSKTPEALFSKTPEAVVSAEDQPTIKSLVSEEEMKTLEDRKSEYRAAALKAKHENNRSLALEYFRTLKKIDCVIQAAKEGKSVDLSQMPPQISVSQPTNKTEMPRRSIEEKIVAAPTTSSSSTTATESTMQSMPTTLDEHLVARLEKYQSTANEASKQGNSGKARRMMRIVKQYQSAIKSHKAGKVIDFNDLPTPPGFPPFPGQDVQTNEINLLQRAAQLAQEDPEVVADDEEKQSQLSTSIQPTTSLPKSQPSTTKPESSYNAQLKFLINRKDQFKQATLKAKQDGNRELALQYLKKMKGFDPLISAAKSGVKVDISKVPQPPVLSKSKDDFVIIEKSKVEKKIPVTIDAKNDGELYNRITSILKDQVKKARAHSQLMTYAGDVRTVEECDSLATSSQTDLDYVISCHRHKDPPPRFYYIEKTLKSVEMNPRINNNELEVKIVQCIGVANAVRDNKTYVEWELPFPHQNPIKGQTEEAKLPPGPPTTPLLFGTTVTVPFNRKLKSNHRNIRTKSLKIALIAKGGFLKSSKVLGSGSVKLSVLEESCTLHAIEKLTSGSGDSVGKIEVVLSLRTPLNDAAPKMIKERWLIVEQGARFRTPDKPTTSTFNKSQAPKAPVPASKSPSTLSTVNISSMEAAAVDYKLICAQVEAYKKRNQQIPRELLLEGKQIKNNIEFTRNYLREGGASARKEYQICLTQQHKFLTQQVEQYQRSGKVNKTKISLKKRDVIAVELSKFK